jgi:hypothetical protein
MTVGPLSMAAVDRREADFDAARDWADRDWVQLDRLVAWVNYMVVVDPPAIG